MIQELIKKYQIEPVGDQIRVKMVDGAEEKELEQIKSSKQEILQYFRDQEETKKKQEEELLMKARRGVDGLFLVLDYDTGYDPQLKVARRLTEEEKKGYMEWFAESAFVGMGCDVVLTHMKFKDMPKKKTDGTFLGGSNLVWIITPEEYDHYIEENDKREREHREAELEKTKILEENAARVAKEKEDLLSQVDDWTTEEYAKYDEGGKTKVYKHTFSIGGETLKFTERNVFDVGVVINPDYPIKPGHRSGGIAIEEDGVLQWSGFEKAGTSMMRPLTENEKICWTIIAKFGKYSGARIRMGL